MNYVSAKKVRPGDHVLRKADGKRLRVVLADDLYYAYPVPTVMLTCDDGLTYAHISLRLEEKAK